MAPPDESERPWRKSLGALRARWGVILLAMVLVPVGAFAASSRQTAVYEASAKVFPSQGNVPGDVARLLHATFKEPERATKTQAAVAHTPALAERVVATARLRQTSAAALLRDSSITATPGGELLDFSVRSHSPQLAQRLANEYARQYTLYRRELDQIPIRRALDELHSSGSTGGAEQARELETLEALNGAAPPVVNQADSAGKVRPQTARNLVTALLLGTVFGIALALLWEALGNRVRSSAVISGVLGLPELGRVPAGDALSEPGSASAERFLSLRTHVLLGSADVNARTIVVTSAHRGEGKSGVAANLADQLARTGSDVTVVEAPPLLAGGDGIPVASKTDAVLLVIRHNALSQPALGELRRVLASIPAHKLGFVLTGAGERR